MKKVKIISVIVILIGLVLLSGLHEVRGFEVVSKARGCNIEGQVTCLSSSNNNNLAVCVKGQWSITICTNGCELTATSARCKGICNNGVCEPDLGEDQQNCREDCGSQQNFSGLFFIVLIIIIIIVLTIIFLKRKSVEKEDRRYKKRRRNI